MNSQWKIELESSISSSGLSLHENNVGLGREGGREGGEREREREMFNGSPSMLVPSLILCFSISPCCNCSKFFFTKSSFL